MLPKIVKICLIMYKLAFNDFYEDKKLLDQMQICQVEKKNCEIECTCLKKKNADDMKIIKRLEDHLRKNVQVTVDSVARNSENGFKKPVDITINIGNKPKKSKEEKKKELESDAVDKEVVKEEKCEKMSIKERLSRTLGNKFKKNDAKKEIDSEDSSSAVDVDDKNLVKRRVVRKSSIRKN